MKKSTLFTILPDYVNTPDGMAIDRHGNLILSCPNFYDDNTSGLVVKIDKEGNVTKWFDMPVHPETGIAANMGICFDDDWNMYVCDNQSWTGKPELAFKGRVLKVTVDDEGNISKWVTVATGMEHPNGIRVRGNYMYLTQSLMTKVNDPSGKMVSCVYRFGLDEHDLVIDNLLDDPHIIATFLTQNPDCQYGADGIVFDEAGNLYVGNFGDGTVYRITFNEDGSVKENKPWAWDAENLSSTDGMIFDDKGNLYIADYSVNAIGCVCPDGKVERLAQSPDSDGTNGELDQPGEPIFWNGKIIASCFNMTVTPWHARHTAPCTLAQIELD